MNHGVQLIVSCFLVTGLVGCSSKAPQQTTTHIYHPPVSQSFSKAGGIEQAQDILFRAIGLVGTPYVWGGNTPDSGFDCSGLITYVYNEAAGVKLPRTTQQMASHQAPKVARGQWKSGDILYFSTSGNGQVSHAGIYVGEGRFVHAPSSGGTVRLDRVDNVYWQKAYLTANRPLAKN